MNKIKIGDRVSARAFMGIECLGTVVDVEETQPYSVLVKFDSWSGGHNAGVVDNLYDHSQWWFNGKDLVVVGKSDE